MRITRLQEKTMRWTLILMLPALLLAAGSAHALDMPRRKPGLWEIKVRAGSAGGLPVIQQCIDAKTDNLLEGSAGEPEKCSKQEVRKDGERYIADYVCKVDGSTATMRAVITGKFDSAYRVESHVLYNPPLEGMKEGSVVMEGKWLGPCKPGQKPGDVIPQLGRNP